MRITIRIILSLVVVISLVSCIFAYLQVAEERDRQEDELARRSGLLAESLEHSIARLLDTAPSDDLRNLVEKFGNRERLAGLAVFDRQGIPIAMTSSIASFLSTPPNVVFRAFSEDAEFGEFDRMNGRDMHLYAKPLQSGAGIPAILVICHDATFIQARLSQIWRHTFIRLLIQMVLISLVTLLVVRWNILGPIARMADWMKMHRTGETSRPFTLPKEDMFAPIVKEAGTLTQNLSAAKTAVEEEARLRLAGESLWTPARLKEHVKTKLRGKPLFVVSNREPHMHLKRGRTIEHIVPAGGLVTALEPVLRACEGTWIAHGSGDGDWEVVDARHRIKVPPDDPLYTLRRVALTKEEENGYYYGFANEGLWPLCHIAHTRPTFRMPDWEHYQNANRKFAEAVLEELEGLEEPCVLVQDYHLTLLPRLLKLARPDARIGLFWHIPWPNPEAFEICPWRKELLYGLLGADIVGFQTQIHCNNFLDTVDRNLESRVDWARFAVIKEDHATLVNPFPISVAFPDAHVPPHDRDSFLKEHGIKARYLGIGVERMDYTKGVLERFRAIERFLEKNPAYQGEFVFVQIGAPSRTHIKRYQDFLSEVESEADRINWRFPPKDYKPILFLKKHHEHQEILPFFKAADVCLVTSLHDGMNLVAKEFVAARDDDDGVLILSRFAGASRELRDALIVNPYDIEQMADAIRLSLEMDADEKQMRMRKMREIVKENNVYRWAGNLISALTELRLDQSAAPKIS